jgi:hypothetical protein
VEKIGAIVGDNSGTNDTLCRTISNYLSSEKKINWTQTHLRLRCMGHILNLVAQAFLFTNSEDEKEMESYDQEDIEEAKEEEKEKLARERATKIRTKMGVIGKVHNIVVHIRASPQRTTQFKAVAGKTIPLDNRTRWNSWYQMLRTTVEDQVLNAVRNYTERQISEGTLDKRDDLGNNDIALLRTIAKFLQVIYDATLFLQGQQSTIERVLETVNILQVHMNNSLKTAPKLKSRIENSRAKLDLYVLKLEQTPYYAAARVLNPTARTKWIRDEGYAFKVQHLWEKYRRENFLSSYEATAARVQKVIQEPVSMFEQLRQDLIEIHRRPQSQDEFENYCNEPISYGVEIPLKWWLEDTQRNRWPQLSSWAIEILSIPSMSDKPERIFSGGRRTVSWDKTAMSATTLEMLECGRDWKREDLLEDNF